MLLMGRTPELRSRSRIQAGEGWIFTFFTIRAVYRGQRSPSSMSMSTSSAMEPPQPFTSGVCSFRGRAKGGAGLPCKADDGQAVGPVGGDLKFHHMIVRADDLGHIVAGLHILVQHEDAVGDAVGELLLLRVEILQRADGNRSWCCRPPDRPHGGWSRQCRERRWRRRCPA